MFYANKVIQIFPYGMEDIGACMHAALCGKNVATMLTYRNGGEARDPGGGQK